MATIPDRSGAFRHPRLAAVALLLTLPVSLSGQRTALPETGSVVVERPAEIRLAEQRRLASALAALEPQRPGVVDAYIVVVALHTDPVFGREARETARVLSRRYDGKGRTIVLAGDSAGDPAAGPGSPDNLTLALAKVGQLADRQEDAVILYTTTHGSAENGLQYRDPKRGYGWVPPARLAQMLDEAGIANRLVILSACYAGFFLPRLASPNSVVMGAAASDRPSFGCSPGNDWTYFGDALVNRALRKPQPLASAFAEARRLVSQWEGRVGLPHSNPQISIGRDTSRWLAPLEKRMPKQASAPVGRSPAEGSR